jgi:hypothetical protein
VKIGRTTLHERPNGPAVDPPALNDAALAAPDTCDPILADFELILRATFYPQGFPVDLVTNSRDLLAAAQESWGHFQKMFDVAPVELQLGVLPGTSDDRPGFPSCRARENMLTTIADGENFTVCDMTRGFAFGWLTEASVADKAYTRYYFLEGTVLTLLGQRYLTPLHAACVNLSDRGVLLCGDSGAGKSSLSYACARRGWTFVADDSSSLVRDQAQCFVVGNPYQMRFRVAAPELFPELRSQRVRPRATGDMAIEVATATLPDLATALTSPVDYIVFLNRKSPGSPRLDPLAHDAAREWFAQVICYGEKAVREAQIASLDQLLSRPIYELRYRDLDSAVNRLEALVRNGE